MINLTNQQAAILMSRAVESETHPTAHGSSPRDATFWLVQTIGGSGLRPSTTEYYTVRASTTVTGGTEKGVGSTARRRLLVEAQESGIRALEVGLYEAAGVQSVESEPAPDGDYLDEDHSGVVTLRHGQIVDD